MLCRWTAASFKPKRKHVRLQWTRRLPRSLSTFKGLYGIIRILLGRWEGFSCRFHKHGVKQIIPIAGFSASIRPVVDNNRNLVFGFNVHDVQGNVGADERHRTAIRAGIADWMLSDRRL